MHNSKTICLCPSSLPESIVSRLSEDFNVIPLLPDRTVDLPVQCHPDMLCASVDGTLFFHESYAAAYPALVREIAEKSGCGIVLTAGKRSKNYPEDISLNAAILPRAVVCNAAHTAPELIAAAEKSGRNVIHVKQGYAACSSMISGDTVLTSDMSIFRALTGRRIDCTYISSDGIALPGYGCGFIGGCGGIFGGKLYLFGTDESMADPMPLRKFALNHGLVVVCLSNDALTDHGGLKFL